MLPHSNFGIRARTHFKWSGARAKKKMPFQVISKQTRRALDFNPMLSPSSVMARIFAGLMGNKELVKKG